MNRNILANIAGKFWSTLSNFLFIPLYIHLLGMGNYAVISFALIVSGVLVLLDLGLSMTISREMARGDIPPGDKYRVFRTLEVLYLAILTLCVVAGLALASPVATHFIKDSQVSVELLTLCLKIIACEAGLQMFFRFYVNAMMGMERQVEANLFNIAWGVARNGLVVLLLLVAPTLTAFFTWQLGATLCLLLLARAYLARSIRGWRPAVVPLIDREALRRVRGFAGGMFLISLVAVVNTQLDRLTLSYLLDLEYLGYYTIGISIGTGMLALSSPFLAAIQPRLTRWFSEGRAEDARALYLRVTTLVAILVFPLMAVIGLNAETVVMAWTRNATVAANAAPIVPWLVGAYGLLAMSSMTYGVALANGFTRYNNLIGLATLFVSVPGYWLAVTRFGAVGAAGLFCLIQIGVSTTFHVLVERRFLQLGMLQTYLRFFVVPAAIAFAVAAAVASAPRFGGNGFVPQILYLGAAYAAALAATALGMKALFGLGWRLQALMAGDGVAQGRAEQG